MKEVQITSGKVVLKKPTAGARNNALMKAETPDGIKNTVYMIELLPFCIQSHPFGSVPIRQALDSLDVDDYDELITALHSLMNPTVLKQEPSEEQSEPVNQTISTSEKS